jgi:hypothetical protein
MAKRKSAKGPVEKRPAKKRPVKKELVKKGPVKFDVEINGVSIVVWAARLSLYFLLQGGIILLSYAYYGFGTDPNSFALGFRLDPIHAAVHFVWGAVGSFIGFYAPRYSTYFLLAFAVFYTIMAVLGTFTVYHLGMHLDAHVNMFHWFLVPFAWAFGLFGLWQERGSG